MNTTKGIVLGGMMSAFTYDLLLLTSEFKERLNKTETNMLWFIWFISLFLNASIVNGLSRKELKLAGFV
ncbi:CLUMA_CG007610, isoform A [Clunio marinus]|uniref:CLUMA_CG007610, isoform A n=1 Tax=Clunio marinus TaxID=568069 RepID=A0A1J1I160_9DIPT|nr:CLUMA_CG007610, isoform A [Clunio marinus]